MAVDPRVEQLCRKLSRYNPADTLAAIGRLQLTPRNAST